LKKKINIKFNDLELLKKAFVHRSYINENKNSKLEHNERLEFLGDAVLELVITDFLFKRFADKDEGVMTSYRSALVNADTCSKIATDLDVNDFLLLSKGEAKDTGKARQYILANALEAIIGAIYLDQGYDMAKVFIEKYFTTLIDKIMEEGLHIDAKSLFQEKAQDIDGVTPIYKTIKETGPDHEKVFTVALFVGNDEVSVGVGRSKQDAEQEAARKALKIRGWK
jgi:ribonuclease-3